MPKDAFYFPHDSNAKDDPKCVLLIDQLGLEGYGIYWVLIETLRDQPNYQYPLALLPSLARRFNTSAEKLRAVVCNYQLFKNDETMFFSESLLERMEIIDNKREQGRNAALMRWHSVGNTKALPEQCGAFTSKVKESKEKKVKKSIYGELQNVFLTDEEYQKLKERFNGQTETLINNLSTYIASRGDKYKSHYATILSWAKNEPKDISTENKDDENW